MEDDAILEARKKAKRSGEEDPLVVAQRFLNIYRQIHIFSPDKKESFNKMVLELPPETRGMFGQLPGGILLQEYVDELAEQRGIEKSIHTSAETQNLEETDSKQAKILATALAQAQVQASAQMQAMGMSPATPIATNTPVQTAPAKLSMDKDFAKEFALALGNVLQQNSSTQNDDIKNIALALNQGHLSFLRTMQTENQAHREEMKKISLAMLQIQQKAANSAQAGSPQVVSTQAQPTSVSSESKQLIQMFLSNQKEVMEKIAKLEAQTQNIPVSQNQPVQNVDNAILWQKSEQTFAKIASLLYEGQKNTSLEISKLINENQQNILKILSQNNNINQNSGNASASNNIQINSADYSAVLNSIAEKLGALSMPTTNVEVKFPKHAFGDLIEAQSKLYREIAKDQTKELSSVIAEAFKESQKASTQSIIDALKSSQQPIIMSQPVIMNPSQDTFTCDFEKKTNIDEDYDFSTLEPQVETLKTEETPTSEKKKKKKKKKKLVEENFAEFEESNNFFAIQDSSIVDIQEEAPFEDNDQSVSDFDFFDIDNNVTEDTLNEQQNLEQESCIEENPVLNDINDIPVEKVENVEDTYIPQDNVVEDFIKEQETSDFDFFDDIVTDIENIKTDRSDLSEKIDDTDSWEFSSDDSNTNETTESIDINSSETSPDDWGFYADASLSTEDNGAGEGIDWEWEYVEEDQIPSANTNESSSLTPLGVNSMLYTGEIIFDSKSILGSQKTTSNVQNSITFSNATIIDSFNDESETKDPYLK